MDDKERLDAIARNVEKLIQLYQGLKARVDRLDPPRCAKLDEAMNILDDLLGGKIK